MQTLRQYNSCKNSCKNLQKLNTSSAQKRQIQIQKQTCKYNHENTNSSRSHGDQYFIYYLTFAVHPWLLQRCNCSLRQQTPTMTMTATASSLPPSLPLPLITRPPSSLFTSQVSRFMSVTKIRSFSRERKW